MNGVRTTLLGRLPWGLAVVLAALTGCGYSSGKVLPETVGSVGIEIFGNTSLEPDLEQQLHEELSASMRDLVHARIVAPQRADLVIRGQITEYRRRGGVRNTDNELLESGVGLTVVARLVDREGVDVKVTGPSTIWVGYLVDESEGELGALDRAMRNIADRIVLDLFAPVD